MENINNPILEAFKETGLTFYKLLHEKKFVPTYGKNGFTERNLTFNLCRCYYLKHPDSIIWQEMPFIEGGLLDSIIIDENGDTIDIYYIEAKRIYTRKFAEGENKKGGQRRSLKDDYIRLNKCKNKNFTFNFPGLYNLVKSKSTVRQHIVFIAGMEHIVNNKKDTFFDKIEGIKSFMENKDMNFFHFNVNKKTIDNEYHISEEYSKDNLCMNSIGTVYMNYHLYLMMKTIESHVDK